MEITSAHCGLGVKERIVHGCYIFFRATAQSALEWE